MTGAFARETEEVLAALGVDPKIGLGDDEVTRRRKAHGPNRLRQRRGKSVWAILFDQVRNLIFLLLAVAAVTSFVFSEAVQGAAIIVAMLINAAIGFVTEWRARRSMEALRRLERIEARVVRGGEERRIPAERLVPGDIVPLAAGDLVPADLRLVESSKLRCDEAQLTGESVPVDKAIETLPGEPALAERSNMAFKGTFVASGAGLGVVVGIGRDTELGRITDLVATAEASVTPLERQLDQLARRLLLVILIVAAAIAAVGVAAGRDLLLMIETGIALVVAAVPEGLPIVASVALARGMWRLARRNALIEKLSAVETLGSTTVICTDKTGTLTENRMTLRRLVLARGDVEVTDDEPPCLRRDGEDAAEDPALRKALEIGALCTSAELAENDRGGKGDPMELALLAGAAAAGINREALLERQPELRREEFEPATRMMATFHQAEGGVKVTVKGAPEAVIEACTRVRSGEEAEALDEAGRARWRERNEALARSGLRALALAEKSATSADDQPYQDLELIGLVGLLDPPRRDVRDAIRACREAGIRVVMVTGDQPATARAIAEAVGLVDAGDDVPIVHGGDLHQLEGMSEAERRRVLEASILARVDPKQKLDLIRIHQEDGARVAMTGDGVNDAPALKKADIGIAMGQRGTQVAREAAHMVLRDDSFATIVLAIAQGRVIFDNIRRFIVYMLSGNAGEIFAVAVLALLNAPLPLLPLQILYINLISDVFPALALGVGRGENPLDRPARDPDEPIVARRHWLAIGGYGVLIGSSVMAVFAYALLVAGMATEQAVTISFLTFALGRLWHVFNMREPGSDLLRNTVTTNPWVWGALGVGIALLAAALHVPLLADVLETVDPGATGWLLIAIGSLVPLVIGQILKIPAVRAALPSRLLPAAAARQAPRSRSG
jgi:Ca2+-transporting ATPase